jgi:hypothetical protein
MKNSIKVDTLASFNSTGLTGSLKIVNAAGFAGPVAILRIINDCNKAITISYDGSTNHDYLAAGATLHLNIQNNAAPNNYVAMLKKGSSVYVSGAAGTGYIYIAAYYLEA